jgi:hypothetical protein
MAHFAKLNDQNIVEQVIVVGDEYQDTYADWRLEFGERYVQTSYNNKIRYNYAGIGFTYDAENDAFIAPRPECGHKELFLNDAFKWNCQRCELDAKGLANAD